MIKRGESLGIPNRRHAMMINHTPSISERRKSDGHCQGSRNSLSTVGRKPKEPLLFRVEAADALGCILWSSSQDLVAAAECFRQGIAFLPGGPKRPRRRCTNLQILGLGGERVHGGPTPGAIGGNHGKEHGQGNAQCSAKQTCVTVCFL